MTLLNVVSFLVGCYFIIGLAIEHLCLNILIYFYYYFPELVQKILGSLIDKAVERSEYHDLKRVSCSRKFLLNIFVLRYGFTENMLKKLLIYLGGKNFLFLVDDGKVFEFALFGENDWEDEKHEEDGKYEKREKKYVTSFDGNDFDFCAGDIVF